MEVAMLQSPVDVEVIAGRQESRQKAIKLIVGSGERRSDGDCEWWRVNVPVTIKSVSYRGTGGTSKNLNSFLKLINVTVDSTLETVVLTLLQWSISPLSNPRSDACTMLESTLTQPSSFDIYIPFRTWIHVISSYLMSYLDVSCYRNKFWKIKNYWWRIFLSVKTEQTQIWTKQQKNCVCVPIKTEFKPF